MQIPDNIMISRSKVWERFNIMASTLDPGTGHTAGDLVPIDEQYVFKNPTIDEFWEGTLNNMNTQR